MEHKMCALHIVIDFNMNMLTYKTDRLGRATLWIVLNVELFQLGVESYLEPLKDF